MSFTSMVIVALPDPPALVAVIVYVLEAEIAVGVPEIVPLDESKDNPVGSAGEIVHVSTAPPCAVGVTLCI